uniref:rhamnogalacturonan endolyase n=1 Tax=Moniliophthora roreri TaxID=221103 RepID=A0A0W0FC83_MONRR
MLASLLVWSALLLPSVLGFGVTLSGDSLVVDTSAGLIFTVDLTSGDITSMLYNDQEAQDQSKHSQIASGIGASCDWVQTGNDNNYIKITCTTSTLTQYYVAKYNDPSIHMATYTTAEPEVGELRFIARLNQATVPNGIPESNIRDGTVIEGSDVFLVDGETRSKFYSSVQFIDDQVHGVTGSGIGVYMAGGRSFGSVIPGTGYEGSSGGPFFRDINNQGSSQQELYFYMVRLNRFKNSNHAQTEEYRMGLHGPYALVFTGGEEPSANIDLQFWEGLDIEGFVPQSDRGRVSGTASGIPSDFASLQSVGFSNAGAQYWARTDNSGSFVSPYMKPGTYTMTLYKVELAVATQEVTVSAGETTTSDIASEESTPEAIWQIGDFDGTPRGFLNADKIEKMHPSDSRMSDWGPVTFSVGDDIATFPMAVFKAIGGVTINFNLEEMQSGARTLDIGTTLAFADGRPQVNVNGWDSEIPSPPEQPDSRGVTRGTWRGNNILYTIEIPDGTLVAGSNTLTISPVSGSDGADFLSSNFIFDAVRLY